MYRVACGWLKPGLTTGVVAAFVLAGSVPAAMAADSTDAPAKAQTPAQAQAPAQSDDYYTRRAKGILAAEKNGDPKPSPLAAKYPGKDVVVCEAGCPQGRGAHIVSIRAAAAVTAAREAVMVPTSATIDAPASKARQATTQLAVCVAGCYDDFAATVDNADLGVASDPEVRGWVTTTAPKTPPLRAGRDKFSPIR